jgi:transcriptional antiterminator RfaH
MVPVVQPRSSIEPEQPVETRMPVLSVITAPVETVELVSNEIGQKTSAWYLVYTKPRQEGTALINLECQGYQCYLPQLRTEKIRRRKAEIVTESLFPRYLFVRLDTSGNGKSWSPIRSTFGVSQLVHFGGRPAKVNNQLVELLRVREQARPTKSLFDIGDAVMITDGPFAGFEAIYQTADAERRSMILLEILSKSVSMQIDIARLRKVG